MKIVSFSDTHNLHEKVILPECDISIFAGDFSGRGNRLETFHFFKWYSKQTQCRFKVATIGNHDICFDPSHNNETHGHNWLQSIKDRFNNIIILNNTSVDIEGVKIWGSPYTPWYHGERWGFNVRRDEIHNIWNLIPKNTDIVVTHGPVRGILDTTIRGDKVGCVSLYKKIKYVKPKYHICGHIHEAYGVKKDGATTFINCAVVNMDYDVKNKPIEFEI